MIERNVDIGQTVAASFQAPVLFLIANDLTKMQVIAQIDEADIGAISEMAEVDFAVDAFPGQTFEGKILRDPSQLQASQLGHPRRKSERRRGHQRGGLQRDHRRGEHAAEAPARHDGQCQLRGRP